MEVSPAWRLAAFSSGVFWLGSGADMSPCADARRCLTNTFLGMEKQTCCPSPPSWLSDDEFAILKSFMG